MNDELESVWKEAVMAQSRYTPGVCMEEMKKSIRNLSK
jgi:hypothetical protein